MYNVHQIIENEGEHVIKLTARQKEIINLVKKHEPITGDQIAELLGVSKPTLRSDLAVLVMIGMLNAKPKVGYYIGTKASDASERLQTFESMLVRDILSVPVVIKESAMVQDAVVMLFTEDVGTLVVVRDDGEPSGIISRKDLLKVTTGNSAASQMPVSLVMTRQPNLITASPDDTVAYAAEKMIYHGIDSLPVIQQLDDGKTEIVGRVTKTTMTRVLLELLKKG